MMQIIQGQFSAIMIILYWFRTTQSVVNGKINNGSTKFYNAEATSYAKKVAVEN